MSRTRDEQQDAPRGQVIELPTAVATTQSPEAERYVLGAVMLCPEVLDESELVLLKAEDFHQDQHRALYGLLMRMRQRGDAIELLSVIERVQAEGRAEQAGGLGYVSALLDGVGSVESAGYYARIIRQRATVRIIRQRAVQLLDLAGRGDVEIADLQREAGLLSAAADARIAGQDWMPVSEVLGAVYQTIQRRMASGGEEPGLPCGVLSRMLRAKGGQMIVLAARPAMGKTGLALEWAEHLTREGHGVGYVSAEMPPADLEIRRLAKLAGLEAWKVERGDLTQGDMDRITRAASELSALPLWFTDAPGLTVEAVRARIYGLQRTAERAGQKLSVVFVDHIGKLKGQPGMKLYEAQTYVSAELSALALRTGLCIVALAQLNREVEKRNPPRPVLSDLRESGRIEEDARCVILLYRPGYYDERSANASIGEVIIAKQNGGPTGSMWLPWQPRWGSYDLKVEGQSAVKSW